MCKVTYVILNRNHNNNSHGEKLFQNIKKMKLKISKFLLGASLSTHCVICFLTHSKFCVRRFRSSINESFPESLHLLKKCKLALLHFLQVYLIEGSKDC